MSDIKSTTSEFFIVEQRYENTEWECRPYCNCELTFDEALLEAISPPPPKRLLT